MGLAEYRDYADARRQLGRFLDAVYNRKRIHSALGSLTPAEFEQQWRADRRGLSWFHNPPSRWPGSAESRENLGPVNIHATPEWGYETGSRRWYNSSGPDWPHFRGALHILSGPLTETR